AGVYDKRRLTLWAEAAPWPLSHLPMLRGESSGAYSPGDTEALLDVRGTRLAVLICSEAIYAPLARASARAGAALFVNIANDGWFGTRAAGLQHLRAVLLRAVENRRPLLRATTTGITAAVDARGAIVEIAPRGEPASLVVDIAPQQQTTVYT